MYTLRRLLAHEVIIRERTEEHKILKSDQVFLLTDDEFMFLMDLPREYQYHEFDNEFYIDRHPTILEEGIDNQEFIEDYKNHLSAKFFVLYEYKKVEENV